MSHKVLVTALLQPSRRSEYFEPLEALPEVLSTCTPGYVQHQFPSGGPSITLPAPVLEFPAALLATPGGSATDEAPHKALVEQIKEHCVAQLLPNVVEGRNACLFLVGATADVKESLMVGSPDSCGLLPALLKDLLGEEGPLRRRNGEHFLAEASYVAVSANSCFDLLDLSNLHAHVALCEEQLADIADGKAGVEVPSVPAAIVRGATSLRGESTDDALRALDDGLAAATAINESRRESGATAAPPLEHSATMVFSLEVDTNDTHSVFQIVALGDDARLLDWLCEAAAIADRHQRKQKQTNRKEEVEKSGGGEEQEKGGDDVASDHGICAEFAAHVKSFQHNAVTLMAPLLCNGNAIFSCVVGIEQSSQLVSRAEHLGKLCENLSSISTTPIVNYCSSSNIEEGIVDNEPLPEGWGKEMTADGKIYFVDHINKTTTWNDPRHSKKAATDRKIAAACEDPSREVILGDPTRFVNYRNYQTKSDESVLAECAIVVVGIDNRPRVIVPSKELQFAEEPGRTETSADGGQVDAAQGDDGDAPRPLQDGVNLNPGATEEVQRDPLVDDDISAASRVVHATIFGRQIPPPAPQPPKPSSAEDEIESLVNEFHHMFSEAAKSKAKWIRAERDLHALKVQHESLKEAMTAKEQQCEQLLQQQQQRSTSTASSAGGDSTGGGGEGSRSPEMIVIKQLRQRLDAAESRVAELELELRNNAANSSSARSTGDSAAPSAQSVSPPPPPPVKQGTLEALHRLVSGLTQEVRQRQSSLPEKLMDDLSLQLLPSVTVPDDERTLSQTVLNVVRSLANAVADFSSQECSRRRGHPPTASTDADLQRHGDDILGNGGAAAIHNDPSARIEVERIRASFNERFVLLTKQMCQKQEEIVRRLHSDYEAAIQKEKKRSQQARNELEALREALQKKTPAEEVLGTSIGSSATSLAMKEQSEGDSSMQFSWGNGQEDARYPPRRTTMPPEIASVDRLTMSSSAKSPISPKSSAFRKAQSPTASAQPRGGGGGGGGGGANGSKTPKGFTTPLSAREILRQDRPDERARFSTAQYHHQHPVPLEPKDLSSLPSSKQQRVLLTSPKRIEHGLWDQADGLHLQAPWSTSTATRSHEMNVRSFVPFGAAPSDVDVSRRPAWRVSSGTVAQARSPSRLTEFQLMLPKRASSPS